MENRPLTSPDGSRNRNTPGRCLRPLHSQDSAQEHHNITGSYQNDGLVVVKVEMKDEEELERDLKSDEPCKEKNVPAEIRTDGSSNRNTPERCPSPVSSQDSTQEDQTTSDEYQDENLVAIKVEVKDDGDDEETARTTKHCKEEERSPEIHTGRRTRSNPAGCSIVSPDGDLEDNEITMVTLGEITPNVQPCLQLTISSTMNFDDMMENRPPLTSPDPGETRVTPRNLKEEGQRKIKEETIVTEISTDGSSYRNTPERCPRPLYSRDSTQEHHEIPQGENRIDMKAEVKEEAETEVKDEELWKAVEMPPEKGPGERSNSKRTCPTVSPGDDMEDDNITVSALEENPVAPNLQPVKPKPRKPAYCSECGKCFTRKAQLVHHQRMHTGEKPYLCTECGRCFTQKIHLDKHRSTHSGEKPFGCSDCGKYFSRRCSLVQHQGMHMENKPYSCSECDKSFTAKSSLVGHLRTHTGEKPFSCPKCGKAFTAKSSLAIHENIHLEKKPFSCTECSKCFVQKFHLEQHQRIHTGEKPYACAECGKSFSSRYKLMVHEKTHNGQSLISCSECGKSFATKSTLVTHRKIHTGVKPYVCSECGKCFTLKSHLVTHQRLHKDDKCYVCSECGKGFTWMTSLVKHRRIHKDAKLV